MEMLDKDAFDIVFVSVVKYQFIHNSDLSKTCRADNVTSFGASTL